VLTNRSRSAPPIPREQIGKRPSSQSGVPPKIEDRNNEPAPLFVEVVDEKTNVPHLDLPTVHTMFPTSISSPNPQWLSSQPQTPNESTALPASTLGSHLTVAGPSRSTSPVSLEAYLLERKRRGVSGGGVTPRIVTPAAGVKGKGFKSSPLSPTEKDVADGIKRTTGVNSGVREGGDATSETVVEDDGLS